MGDNRGGPRTGSVGGQYPNRKDMRVPGAPIGPSNLPASAQYGQGVQQAQGLRVTPAGPPSSPPSPQGGGQGQPMLAPGDVPGLGDPTANPNEPVTAGLPIGPGAGPEALGIMTQDSPELGIARRLFLEYPNPDLRNYIAYLESTLQF